VLFVFGDRLSESVIRSMLGVTDDTSVLMCGGASQHSLVSTLSESLFMAASRSSPMPTVRSVAMSSLLTRDLMQTIWAETEATVRNFHVTLVSIFYLTTYYIANEKAFLNIGVGKKVKILPTKIVWCCLSIRQIGIYLPRFFYSVKKIIDLKNKEK